MAADTNLTIGHNLLPKTSGNINLGDSTHKWVIDASQISGTVGAAKTATTASNLSYEAGTADAARTVWFSDSGAIGKLVYDNDFKYNPATNVLTVGSITGSSASCTGNAATATKFASNQSVALTGDVTGSASSQAGWSISTTLKNSGVTKGSYGPSANASPAHGGSFSVPYVTVDEKGRVTGAATRTITLPGDSDTKNTAGSTDTSSKIYLVGATSQATNPQTYSDNEVYATSGVLTTKKVQVGGTAATMEYDSTNKCINFVFA